MDPAGGIELPQAFRVCGFSVAYQQTLSPCFSGDYSDDVYGDISKVSGHRAQTSRSETTPGGVDYFRTADWELAEGHAVVSLLRQCRATAGQQQK